MDPLVYYEKYWTKDEPPPESDPTTPERERLLLSTLGAIDHKKRGRPLRILDAGCGNGWFLERLIHAGYEAHGVEASRSAVEEACRRCPEARITVGSLENDLSYADAFFDAIWCTEVIEHLFDIDCFLGSMSRVLKPNGLLILTTPYHGLIKNLAIAALGFDRHFDPAKSHIRFFSIASLDAALGRASLSRTLWRGVGRYWPIYMSMYVVARKNER